jgi:hypothetical protein
MFHQQFLVYQLPNENKPKQEITKGRAWSQFKALALFYVLPKNRVDVLPLRRAARIAIFSLFQ